MNLPGFLEEPVNTAKRMKNMIIFFAIVHMVFLVFGGWTVAREIPGVMYIREEQLKMLADLPYLKPLTGPLAPSLVLKIAYTFIFNLILGAFFSTTFLGLIFFMPYLIAVWRGFIIGVLFYGLDAPAAQKIAFYGTFILEFGAYSVSSAAGTNLGLSFLMPWRKGRTSRKEAFFESMRDVKRIYVIVAIILFVAAVWEIGWLHSIGPFIVPPGVE